MGGFHQEGPEERAASFADAPLAVLLAGLHDRRIETDNRVTCLARVKRWGSSQL